VKPAGSQTKAPEKLEIWVEGQTDIPETLEVLEKPQQEVPELVEPMTERQTETQETAEPQPETSEPQAETPETGVPMIVRRTQTQETEEPQPETSEPQTETPETEEPQTHTHQASDPVRENEVAATCLTAGSYDEVVYCSSCGEEISRTGRTIDALGHDWGNEEVLKEATCATGLVRHTCLRCRLTEEITTAATSKHTFAATDERYDEEYEEDGNTVAVYGHYEECSVCGERKKVEDGRETIGG
jgi:hypothetical protein